MSEEQKPKRKYTRRHPVEPKEPKESAAAKMSRIEAGYQDTVKIQLDQIRDLIQKQSEIEVDVIRIKSERDELLRGLLSLRTSIDKLHRILHEGEDNSHESE